MNAVTATDRTSANIPIDVEGGEVYEMLATHLAQTLKMVRDTVSSYIDGLTGAEKARAAHVTQQIDAFIKQLEEERNVSGLEKFLKAVGPISLFIVAVAVFVAPSPMTIALLVVSVAMFLEPMISEAAGAESFISQGMEGIFNGLNDMMGPIGAAVVTAVIMLVIVALATTAVAAGLAMTGAAASSTASTTASTLQAMGQLMKQLPSLMGKAMFSSLDETQTRQLQAFLQLTEAVLMTAQAGVQVSVAVIHFDMAKMMHALGVQQAMIDQWMKIIEMVTKDMSMTQELIRILQDLMPQLFDQGVTQ